MEINAFQHFQRSKTLMDILNCYHILRKGTTILQIAQIFIEKLGGFREKQYLCCHLTKNRK
jgi:hypothetical protein